MEMLLALYWSIYVFAIAYLLRLMFSIFLSRRRYVDSHYTRMTRKYMKQYLIKAEELDWNAATCNYYLVSGDDKYVHAYRAIGTDYYKMWGDSYERLLNSSRWM